jgi:hypothetical protein
VMDLSAVSRRQIPTDPGEFVEPLLHTKRESITSYRAIAAAGVRTNEQMDDAVETPPSE